MIFATAQNTIKNRPSKKLQNNTYLERIDNDTFGVRLHQTYVVKIHRNGNFTLNSGGWQTHTTKDRINSYSPARLYQHLGIWYVGDEIFHDNMIVDQNGKPLNPTRNRSKIEKNKAKLDKMVRKFINDYAQHVVKIVHETGQIPQPGPGDCWGCYFKATNKTNDPFNGSEPMGLDHYIEHFKQKYYVPSILTNAILQKHPQNPGFIVALIVSEAKRNETRWIKDLLRSFFRTRKPQMLQHVG